VTRDSFLESGRRGRKCNRVVFQASYPLPSSRALVFPD
jgi:hypothetical protein